MRKVKVADIMGYFVDTESGREFVCMDCVTKREIQEARLKDFITRQAPTDYICDRCSESVNRPGF